MHCSSCLYTRISEFKSNQYCNCKPPLNLFQRVIFKELPWLRRAKSITSISGLKPLAKVKAVLNTREDEREESSKKYLSSPRRIEKTNLIFYFHTYLWYLKRFFEASSPISIAIVKPHSIYFKELFLGSYRGLEEQNQLLQYLG